MRKFVAMLLVCLLTAGMMPQVLADGVLNQQEHADAPLEQVESLAFSMEQFYTLEEELETACMDESQKELVSSDLAELKELYLSLNTLLVYYDILSCRDVTNQEANDSYASYLQLSYQVDEEMSSLIETILQSPCSDCIDQEDQVFSLYTYGSCAYTEEELELFSEEQNLIDTYYDIAAQNFTADYQGDALTYDEIVTAFYSGEFDYDTAAELVNMVERAENEALNGIYLQLVENRNAQADIYGYADAADYYDENLYYRDYSKREREEFYAAVKTYIVPLLEPLQDRINGLLDAGWFDDTGYSTEELLSMLRTGLENVSAEFIPALDYMTENGCYDLEYTDVKADMSFTTILSEPNAPYLMLMPYEEDYDFTTLVHEFGHYNAYFCAENTFCSNIDLAEIHSQGLELLMLKNYPQLFGEKAEYEELQTLYQMLCSLVDGCKIDEFERYAYAEKELTAEKLNAKYLELEKEYGDIEENDPATEAYAWVEIPHVFESPMYYLSYGVSTAAAFEIWETSETDYDAALTTYLQLVVQGETGNYFDTLETVGLDSPITKESMEVLNTVLSQKYGLDAEQRDYGTYEPQISAELLVALIEIFGSMIVLGCAFFVIAFRRKSNGTHLVITIRRENNEI